MTQIDTKWLSYIEYLVCDIDSLEMIVIDEEAPEEVKRLIKAIAEFQRKVHQNAYAEGYSEGDYSHYRSNC